MIENNDIERLKEIFVTRKECDERNEELSRLVNRIDVRLSVIENNQNQLHWLVKTILGAVIALVVAAIWSLITKGTI